MSAIIEVRELRKRYKDVSAVDGVSFGVPEGVCFGLLGPNGAGKTTTIEIMEGLLDPTAGEVLFRGRPIDRRFKEKVGIQFQHTALPEFITVNETLKLFSAFYPHPRPLNDVVDICALEEIIDRDNRKLSGGQRQRLLLALAIIPQPQLVFLDEPTTGLDPQARRNFWSLIERVRSEGTTVMLTTHYMDEAQLLCDQVAIMDHGRILEIDSPQTLLERHFEGVVVRLPNADAGVLHNGARLPAATKRNNGALELTTTQLDDTFRSLLDLGVNLDGFSIHKPNLEDLFIKLTGSTLRV